MHYIHRITATIVDSSVSTAQILRRSI